MRFLLALVLLSVVSCADHAGDPHTCRERAAYNVKDIYPDPAVLAKALDTICQGQAGGQS